MRLATVRLFALLICFACTASVQASIIVPAFGERIEEEFLASLEEAKSPSTQASSSRPSRSLPVRLPQRQEETPNRFNAFAGAPSDAGGMSGGGSPTSPGGGGLVAALSAKEVSPDDDALVAWLSRSDWLVISSPRVDRR